MRGFSFIVVLELKLLPKVEDRLSVLRFVALQNECVMFSYFRFLLID